MDFGKWKINYGIFIYKEDSNSNNIVYRNRIIAESNDSFTQEDSISNIIEDDNSNNEEILFYEKVRNIFDNIISEIKYYISDENIYSGQYSQFQVYYYSDSSSIEQYQIIINFQ